MLALCIGHLSEAGYVYIGMDHFAKLDDDLALAQRQGRLHRNFQGYLTHADADLLSCGVSAIGALGATYNQNVRRSTLSTNGSTTTRCRSNVASHQAWMSCCCCCAA